MNLSEEAFQLLYPTRKLDKQLLLTYSGKFSPYNANVRYNAHKIEFGLSKTWRTVSREIQIGLLQTLFLKMDGEKKSTTYTDLYALFMKNIPDVLPKIHVDPQLQAVFETLNQQYFGGFLDMPNLMWGQQSMTRLGCYIYGRDTIVISRVLQDAPAALLGVVLYHEMLHKKHKFQSKNGRSFHHTPAFKADEQKFQDFGLVEQQLKEFLRRKRLRRWIWD